MGAAEKVLDWSVPPDPEKPRGLRPRIRPFQFKGDRAQYPQWETAAKRCLRVRGLYRERHFKNSTSSSQNDDEDQKDDKQVPQNEASDEDRKIDDMVIILLESWCSSEIQIQLTEITNNESCTPSDLIGYMRATYQGISARTLAQAECRLRSIRFTAGRMDSHIRSLEINFQKVMTMGGDVASGDEAERVAHVNHSTKV